LPYFCRTFAAFSPSSAFHAAPLASTARTPLFAGHDENPQSWACIASLIETCKLNGVDPQVYFADVIARLVKLWPAARFDKFMPWIWTPSTSPRREYPADRAKTHRLQSNAKN